MEELLKKANIYECEIKIPSNWSKDMIIRDLYVRLAPHFRRDLNYFLASKEEQMHQYKEGFIFKGPEVNCKTICIFYYELFRYLGIRCQIITTNQKAIPHHALIVEGDNGWYYIDPLKDLFCNQLDLKTHFFAKNPGTSYSDVTINYPFLIEMSEEQIKRLDQITGRLINDYRDSFFEDIYQRYGNSNRFARDFGLDRKDLLSIIIGKLKFAEQQLINLGNIPGIYERKLYYDYLRLQLFSKRERDCMEVRIDSFDNNYCVVLDIDSPNNHYDTFLFTECYEDGKGYVLKRR